MKKLFIILALVVLVSALVIGGCTQPAPGPAPTPTPTPAPEAKVIRIGAVLGLTGPGSIHELMGKDVLLMCVDWINNEKGGVNIKGENYKVELVYEDGHWDPANCVTAATKLVHQENCKFVIGGVVPILIDGMSNVTEKAGVLLTGIRSSNIWPDKPYTFYANYPFTATGPTIYGIVKEANPGMKKVGYLAEDEEGGRVTAAMNRGVARKMGLEPMEVILHPFESPEYSPEWNKILMQKPDAVDTGLKMPQNQANCLKQGRQSGYTGPIFATVPGSPLVLAKLAGKEYADNYTWNSYNPYDTKNTPALIQEMVKKWDSSGHTDPFDPDGTEFWDAIWVTVQAIEKAQSLDPTDVKNAWESMETFEGARGMAKLGGGKTFGINHVVCGPASVCRLNKGETEFIKWFDTWMP